MTQQFDELIKKIHLGINPYTNFPVEQWKPQQWSGWDSQHTWFHESIALVKPHVIIEIGSFLGGSAIWMAQRIRELMLDTAIVCVDTWLAESVLWSSEQWRPCLQHRYGRPEVYNVFMANVIDAQMQNVIIPLPMDSTAGINFLGLLKVRSELIYVDGAHDEAQAYLDFNRCYDELLLSQGILLVDDVRDNNPEVIGVTRALDRFLDERGLTAEYSGRKARIIK